MANYYFGGHFGSHLGFLKMLKGARAASCRFLICMASKSKNHENPLGVVFWGIFGLATGLILSKVTIFTLNPLKAAIN
jgi:hypothetical protein